MVVLPFRLWGRGNLRSGGLGVRSGLGVSRQVSRIQTFVGVAASGDDLASSEARELPSMSQASHLSTLPTLQARAVRTLARSVYRQMQADGYSGEHMVDFASTMLDLVREHWKTQQASSSPEWPLGASAK